MKAGKIIFVLLSLLLMGSRVQASDNTGSLNKSTKLDSSKTFTEMLNIEQFRNLSYSELLKQYPDFYIFSMDYTAEQQPRRIVKAPKTWRVDIDDFTFDNLVLVFVNNQIEQIVLSSKDKGRKGFSVKDFIKNVLIKQANDIISESNKKIVVKLNDNHHTLLECYFPDDYHEPDVNLYISMK